MTLKTGFVEGLNIGLLLLSADYRVIGMNTTARETLRLSKGELGKSVMNYHAPKSQERVNSLLKQAYQEHSGTPIAMIIDVLNKVSDDERLPAGNDGFLLEHIPDFDLSGRHSSNRSSREPYQRQGRIEKISYLR